jgi:sulfur carrier protein
VNVLINGASSDVAENCSVALLVEERSQTKGRGEAVALNGEVVPRSEWAITSLSEGDRVEILGAAQGG